MKQFKRRYSIWDVLDWLSWLVLFGSGYFIEFDYHLYLPAFYLIVRGFGRRKTIKADLKNAVDYCRVRRSILNWAIYLALLSVWIILFVVTFDYLKPYVPEFEILNLKYFIATQFIYLLLVARLQNFTAGIRWYVSGIKLPGERSLLIPWRHISEVKAENGFVYVTVFGKQHKFDVNPDDYRSALHFVRWFDKKKNDEA